MCQRLKDKVAIVTGGGSGIGRAIATRYGTEGAKVVVADIDAAKAEAVAASIVAAGGTAIAVPTDVSKADAVDALFAKTVATYGTVDILVNNAGLVNTERHFLEGDEEWWDRIISVPLRSLRLSRRRAAKIRPTPGDGAILNVSSGGATNAHRGNAAY
ncbi:MAG: SDR family NAD(P)-dependent oxidoreductase, partial [Chloroflexota bacterium]